jgi:hypothetical protein
MKKLILIFLILLSSLTVLSQKKKEIYFQIKFGNIIKGDTEVVLKDNSRVDILTNTYAIEVDFANKWAESIGQSLFYAEMTGKKPAVLLIVKSSSDSDNKSLERLLKIAKKYNIVVWTINYDTDQYFLMN